METNLKINKWKRVFINNKTQVVDQSSELIGIEGMWYFAVKPQGGEGGIMNAETKYNKTSL